MLHCSLCPIHTWELQGPGVESSEKEAHHFPAAGPEQPLITPSVVSGEGLMGLGVSEDQVSADLLRMQEENLKTLSAMPEAECQKEKKTLLQNLSEWCFSPRFVLLGALSDWSVL